MKIIQLPAIQPIADAIWETKNSLSELQELLRTKKEDEIKKLTASGKWKSVGFKFLDLFDESTGKHPIYDYLLKTGINIPEDFIKEMPMEEDVREWLATLDVADFIEL